MSILWWFVKPKEITKEDVVNAEKDYENVFKRWCASSGPEMLMFEDELDKSANRMNKIHRQRKKWLSYVNKKGINLE